MAGRDLPDLVKIDAGGHGPRILAGASEPLGKTAIFVVEAVVSAGYEDSAAETIKWAAGAGYRFIDLTDLHRSPNHDVPSIFELRFSCAEGKKVRTLW